MSIITTWLSKSCPTNWGGFSLGVLWPRDAFQKVTRLCFSNSFSSYSFWLNESRFPYQQGFLPSSPTQDYEAGVSYWKAVGPFTSQCRVLPCCKWSNCYVFSSEYGIGYQQFGCLAFLLTNSLLNVEYLWLAPFSPNQNMHYWHNMKQPSASPHQFCNIFTFFSVVCFFFMGSQRGGNRNCQDLWQNYAAGERGGHEIFGQVS